MMGARPEHVIVVGGGIAGIAAGLRLAQAGVPVTLLETRKKLGGRATSFDDVRSGLRIDNCQHVALGCCTNYIRFLEDLGVDHLIDWHADLYWFEAGGRRTTMKPGPLPAPAHLTGSFLGAKFLSAGEKLAIARAMRAILRTDRTRHGAETFGAWLRARRQPDSAVRKFWAPIIVSACNCEVDRVCAQTALHVFQEGFLASKGAGVMGVPRVPLVELYGPAQRAIEDAGGTIRLGASVSRLGARGVELKGGETLGADRVICALPPERAAVVVDQDIRDRDERFARLAQVTHSPILGVHLVFDDPVLDVHSAVLVDRPTQWLFRKPEAPLGSHVHAVISAADDWLGLGEQEVTRRVMEDVHTCLPNSRDVALVSSRPVMEKRATFAPTPEIEALRPRTLGPDGTEGVILAGDFVRTGWPATMEGATRSGVLAAAAALSQDLVDALEPELGTGAVVRTIARPMARALHQSIG